MTNKRVYIAQLLCPSRHCILALAAECSTDAEGDALGDLLVSHFDAMVDKKLVNAHCHICESENLTVDVAPSRFATMAEAQPFLAQSQEEQMRSRAKLKADQN